MKCIEELIMSMEKFSITNYYNFALKNKPAEKCPACGDTMKGWAKSLCSVCNRYFCQSHMKPYVGKHKKCPDCYQRIENLRTSDPTPMAFSQANSLYNDKRIVEAEQLENAIFASIFGPNNLLKFAADDDQNPDNNDSVVDNSLPPQEPVQEVTEQTQEVVDQPQEPQQPQIDLSSALDSLVGTIAKDIEAQIQMNPDIQLSEEELVELFQKKMFELQAK